MAITIHTNSMSLQAQRNLNKTVSNVQKSVARLSSGFRINSAADDAAGLAISEEMKGDLRSLLQAGRNAADATSLLKTAESGMDDVQGMLQRMRELSIQSSSDTITNTQRGYLQDEVTELLAEMDRISGATEFNGTKLLDGSLNANVQVGLDAGDTINLTLGTAVSSTGLGVNLVDVSTFAGAQTALGLVDTALGNVSGFRATVGAQVNRLEVVQNNLSVTHESLAASHSAIRDVDVANEMASFTKSQILAQAGASMVAQANSFPQLALSLLG